MKKIHKREIPPNKRTNRRIIMLKSIKGLILDSFREGKPFRAQLINVSSTGCQIYSNKVLDNGLSIRLELGSLDRSHNVNYDGKVVWARKNPMKSMGRYVYGINFENMSPEQIKFLETNYSLSITPANPLI